MNRKSTPLGAATRQRSFALLTISLGLILPIAAQAQMLDSLDKALIDSALTLLKLRPDELGFDKLWADDDTFRLDVVEKYLGDPLAFPGYVDQTTAVVDSLAFRPRELFEFIDQQIKVDLKKKEPKPFTPPSITYEPADPFRAWTEALDAAEPLRKRFYAGLDSLDKHDLIMVAPTLWSEAGDSANAPLKGAWQRAAGQPVDTSRKVDTDRVLDIIKKLDVHALMDAAQVVVPAAQVTARGIALNLPTTEPIPGKVKGVTGEVLLYSQTQWGVFVVGGTSDNIYSGDFAAIIDLGGDDVYRGRVGAGYGELGQPYGLLIDLKGDDFYDGQSLSVNQGAGFLGIGVLVDRDGADTYRSGAYAQGAGFFGVGVLADHGSGADDYRGGFFLQGAGHCGVGFLLEDGNEDDRYLSTTWAQGFAGTFGYGLLYDTGGDDNYRCGGAYLHEPLLPHDNRSFSGGFGMGWRPRAGGGIAVLYDKGGGVDFYDAEVMSFGSSYWYSIGILVDDGGNDRYSLAHYGMGSGIHLSLGAFWDKAGDDQYRSRMGVVGGTPHDLSVGIFVDGSGDDSYGTCDGWGGSLTNSFGLFIDKLGNDTYLPRPGGTSLGNVRWARGFGGGAIFLDEEGDDVYPEGEAAADSSLWIQSGWGIGIDLPRDIVAGEREEPIPEAVLTAEDSAKSVEQLFTEASGWEVGNAIASVRRARKALKAKGPEAVRWVVEHKLDTQNSLERIPMEDLVKAYPDSAGPQLTLKLDPKNGRWVVSTAASLLGTIKWKAAAEPLARLLDDKSAEKSYNSIISALGDIGEKRATPTIVKFLKDDKQRRRLAALGALKSLKDSSSIEDVIGALGDPMFTVRASAWDGAVVFGAPVVSPLTEYIGKDDAPGRELAVNALGRIAKSLADSSDPASKATRYRALKVIEKLISADDRFIRAEAVAALYRNSGEKGRLQVDTQMENEYDPVVIAAYKRIKREQK